MKELNNYERIYKAARRRCGAGRPDNAVIHKKRSALKPSPRISIILLDWHCRERFHTLYWLNRQDVPRDQYELIWVELYDRVLPIVMDKADVVITCHQKGLYHKHKGYNIGVLHSQGELVVVCDSDAVYPPDFVSSIYRSFNNEHSDTPRPMVLMHHEWRTSQRYPDDLISVEPLKNKRWQWWDLVPNAGACLTFRKQDIIRFGGFDEHRSFQGYLCGGYELAWRLVNAGLPEVWHDTSVALWHFAHPDPIGSNKIYPTFSLLKENFFPHVDLHAIKAVEAASTGRMLPLSENPDIWRLRMQNRMFGSEFEAKYGVMTDQRGFSAMLLSAMRIRLWGDISFSTLTNNIRALIVQLIGERGSAIIRKVWRTFRPTIKKNEPELIRSLRGYNIVSYRGIYYALPQNLGAIDFFSPEELMRPEIITKPKLRSLIKYIQTKKDNNININ